MECITIVFPSPICSSKRKKEVRNITKGLLEMFMQSTTFHH